ncbi:MAG: PsbP-related protein [Candidatus Thorarchaeota archaeon]
MVAMRNGLGYDTIWGIIGIIAGLFWIGFITNTFSGFSAVMTEQIEITVLLINGFFSLFIIFGIVMLIVDYRKRKQVGYAVYWGRVLRTFISFESEPRPISRQEIGYYKTREEQYRGTTLVKYRNESYHFEISYPEDWSVNEDVPGAVVIFTPFERYPAGFGENFSIGFTELTQGKTLDEYQDENLEVLQETLPAAGVQKFKIHEKTLITLANSSAGKLVYSGSVQQFNITWLAVMLLTDEHFIEITFTTDSKRFKQLEKTYNSIVESFTFFTETPIHDELLEEKEWEEDIEILLKFRDFTFTNSIELMYQVNSTDPVLLLEQIRSVSNYSIFAADFSEPNAVFENIQELSFVNIDRMGVISMENVFIGVFVTDKGVLTIIGGVLTPSQQAEIRELFTRKAKKFHDVFFPGKHE